jgi:hypothetical protein
VPNWFGSLLNFVDASENLVMGDDVPTPLDPPIALVEKEELKKTPLDMNVSQRSREEKPFRRMVCTRVDCSAWDHQLSHNPHPLAIYLKFVPAHGAALEQKMSM